MAYRTIVRIKLMDRLVGDRNGDRNQSGYIMNTAAAMSGALFARGHACRGASRCGALTIYWGASKVAPWLWSLPQTKARRIMGWLVTMEGGVVTPVSISTCPNLLS